MSVDMSIGEHHRGVVLIEWVAGHVTDETRLGAVCEGQRAAQLVQVLAAHRAVRVTRRLVLFVTVAWTCS